MFKVKKIIFVTKINYFNFAKKLNMKTYNYKILISILVLSAIAFSCKAQKPGKTQKHPINNFKDTVSYILGADVAQNLKANMVELNLDVFMQGMKDAYANVDTLFTRTEADQIMKQYQASQQKIVDEQRSSEALSHKLEGQKFLNENRNKPGVKETASGLQYKAIKEGSGAQPVASSKVTVHYEGRLIDGSVFDSSYERNEPATFPLNGVIKGWTEGLQLMNSGSTYELYIPSDLAYGDGGTRGIPGGSLLIFKVELISFE